MLPVGSGERRSPECWRPSLCACALSPPDGVDAALDLIATPTLFDCLAATRLHGTVCMSGMLSNQGTLPGSYPTGDIPRGVRLTGYSGEAANLPASRCPCRD